MTEYASLLLTWLQENETILWWLGAASILTFIGSLILIPYLVVQIPADYFSDTHERKSPLQQAHPILRITGILLKNILGVILILAGIVMLILPGQGILTMLIGLMLMNFPGKYDLERRIIQQPAVLKGINWMREKAHHPALVIPPANAATASDEFVTKK